MQLVRFRPIAHGPTLFFVVRLRVARQIIFNWFPGMTTTKNDPHATQAHETNDFNSNSYVRVRGVLLALEAQLPGILELTELVTRRGILALSNKTSDKAAVKVINVLFVFMLGFALLCAVHAHTKQRRELIELTTGVF